MRSFFDTNVLVYSVDEDEPEKGRLARDLLESETARGAVSLSTQVLQEFYVVVTRKLARALSPERAQRAVEKLSVLPVTLIDPPMILAAVARSREMRLSLWDTLIVEAAIASGATRLLSEDLQHGLEVGGIRVENPFRSTSESSTPEAAPES